MEILFSIPHTSLYSLLTKAHHGKILMQGYKSGRLATSPIFGLESGDANGVLGCANSHIDCCISDIQRQKQIAAPRPKVAAILANSSG